MSNRYTTLPASFFGMPLGLTALGILWRGAAALWSLPAAIGDSLIVIGAVLWLMLAILYTAKWLTSRSAAEMEFAHPVQCCFVGLGGVVGSLVSIGLAPMMPDAARILFVVGAAWTVLFAIHRTGTLWMGGRRPEDNTAVLYLPTVAGSFVNASAAATFGYADLAQLLFGAGLFAWLAIESVLLHRLYTSTPLAVPLRPTLGIQLAPPAVAAVAYLNVGPGQPDLFVHALVGYALLQALVMVRLAPWLREVGATPAWWAFSFGAAALPTAVVRLVDRGDHGLIATLAPVLFVAGNLVIAAIAANTLYLLFSGRLLPSLVVAAPSKVAITPS